MKKHVIIFGKVQGVGFRYWLYEKAIKKNMRGFVKNRTSGEVEALLIGNDKDVNEIIKQCENGPHPHSSNVTLTAAPTGTLSTSTPGGFE